MQAQPDGKFSVSATNSALITLQQQIRVARHDTTRISLLEKLSVVYLNKNKPDSAFRLLQQALHVANQSKRPLDLGRVYRGFGHYYRQQQLPLQRIDAYGKAVYFLQQTNRVPETAETMYALAKSYAQNANQAKAIEQTTKNLDYARKTGYDRWVGSSYALLFSIHTRFGDKKSAFGDLQIMQRYVESHPYLLDQYLAYTMFAEWYDIQGDFPKALTYWQKAWSAVQQLSIPIQTVETCSSISNNLINQKRFDQAEIYLTLGLQEVKKNNPVSAYIYASLASLRQQQNRLPEANQAALMALDAARKIGSPYTIEPVLDLLLRIQVKQGYHQQALATFYKLSAMRDSIDKTEQIRAINEVESRFLFQKKERDIKLLRQNAAIQKLEMVRTQQQTILYGSIAIGLILIVLLLGWIVWQDRRNFHRLNEQNAKITDQAQRLSELNTIKDKLFRLLGHDLRTPVIHLKTSLDQLAMNQRSTAVFTGQTDQLKRTVNSLYYTLDNLLHWTALQQEGILTKPQTVALSDLVAEVMELFESMILQKNITVEIGPGDAFAWTDDGQAQVVIRNICHNALKFSPCGGHIRIGFTQSATEAVVCIADNGIGMKLTDLKKAPQILNRTGTMGETGTGFGLLVCEEFMKRNNGRLEIESTVGKGTLIRLIFVASLPDDESMEHKTGWYTSTNGPIWPHPLT